MANYRAIANGNWSNLAIWQDDSLGYFANSSVLPTTADDVYANNFTITIDGTRNASTIRNTAFTPPTNLGAMSIPEMTSNTTPSGAAIASSVGGGANFNAIWFAYDRSTTRGWQSSVANTGWLGYNFPTGKIIKRYGFFSFSTNSSNPRTWTFEGSNNGSTWTTLDTQTNFATSVSTFHSFDISANTTSYTYYRINITAVQTLGQFPTIVELEMSEVTNLYGSIVAGGQFKFANGGNLTCSASNAIEVDTATATLLFDLPSGQSATFNGSIDTPTPTVLVGNRTAILYTSTGTFNVLGNLGINNSTSNVTRTTFLVSGTGIINYIGNITCSQGGTGTGIHNTIRITSNCIFNHTGNASGGSITSVASSGTGSGIHIASVCTYNQTGNQVGGGVSPSLQFVSATASANIIGNVSGNNAGVAIQSNVASTIDVLGFTTSGSGVPAIVGVQTTFVKLRGNIINTDTYCAIYAGRVVIDNNVTSWQFKDSTNTITRTLYTPGVALGNPATTNVRNGVTYGASGELTGTLVVPNPSNVLLGVPTDNTTGTYSTTPTLIATEIFTKLLSSSDFNTSGSFGKLVKDNLDAQVSTRLATASYVAPDNADIAAIKAVTDTLTDVATETTSLSIKTKTDLIPNSPASNDSVGAIVASYNV
jgi:hypothetical protein